MKFLGVVSLLSVAFCASCSTLFGERGVGGARVSSVPALRSNPRVAATESLASPYAEDLAHLPPWIRPTDKDLERSKGLVEAVRFLGQGEAERAAIQLQQIRSVAVFGSEVTALHAWALSEAGEAEAAKAIAREGVVTYGATSALGYVMAVLFESQGQFAEALPLYRDLSSLDPQNPMMLAACARTAVGARRGSEALEFLDRWMLVATLSVDAQRLRAEALQLSGRFNEALTLYRKLIDTWPQDDVLLAQIAEESFALASTTGEAKHNEFAVELLRRLTEFDPQQAQAFHHLGCALHRLQQLDAATQALRRCLALEPGQVDAGLELSQIYVDAGNPEQSAEVLLDLLRQPLAAKDVEAVQSALLALR